MTIANAISTLRVNPTDKEAWEIIYTSYHTELIAYTSSLLFSFKMSNQDAGDLVHDVFVAVIQHWERTATVIDGPTELLAYLKRAVRNRLIDKYRHEKTASSLLAFLSLTFELAFNTDTNLYRRIFLEQVISNLQPSCKEIMQLYVEQDFAPADLADRLNISPTVFYARWYRCLERARNLITKNVPR